MTRGIDYHKIAPDAVSAIMQLERFARRSGLDPSLLGLVRLQASYQNRCGYCVDMHTKDARLMGETNQRLAALPLWHETPFFTPRERAALAWSEAVTGLGPDGALDPVLEHVRTLFSDAELASLTMVVIAINCWNRLMRTSAEVAGSCEAPAAASRTA